MNSLPMTAVDHCYKSNILNIKNITLSLLAITHFVLLYLVLTRHLDFLFNDAAHRLGPGTDFHVYYNAGKEWLLGNGAYGHGPAFGFRYHPLFAALFGITLSQLSVSAAFAIWVIIQEICFFFVGWRLAFFMRDWKCLLISRIILVFFSPYYLEAYMGQSTFITASLLIGAFELLSVGRTWPFTALLIFSIIIKPIGLVFFPYLLFRKLYKEATVAVIVIIITAAPFFLMDEHSWSTFLAINLRSITAAGWVVNAGNQGFHGFITNLGTRLSEIPTSKLSSFKELPLFWQALLSLLPVFFVLCSGFISWKHRHNLGLAVFLWSAIYLLGYKDVWEHSYSFACLGLLWLYAAEVIPVKILFAFVLLMALPTGFLFYNVPLPPGPSDPEHSWSMPISMLHHATKSIPLLTLYIYVAIACLKAPRDKPVLP
jgi:hypothetical protein